MSSEVFPWHVLVVVTAAGILMFGATKGIEKINKVLMPSFFVLFAILAIRVAFLPGRQKDINSSLPRTGVIY